MANAEPTTLEMREWLAKQPDQRCVDLAMAAFDALLAYVSDGRNDVEAVPVELRAALDAGDWVLKDRLRTFRRAGIAEAMRADALAAIAQPSLFAEDELDLAPVGRKWSGK